MTPLARGFPRAEFEARTERAQALMAKAGLAALLLTTEPELRYYTGFLTRFWESPTRPWFAVLPASGAPIAVIPAIGAHLMAETWITDTRSWNAPDYDDDGVGLLAETLREQVPDGGRIGLADHIESHVRMPLQSLQALIEALGTRSLVSDEGITRQLRLIKSGAEIAKIRRAAEIGGRAFDRVAEIAHAGEPLEAVFRAFQILALEEGADWVPYLAGALGTPGYGDVISPATDAKLGPGNVLMLDTGLVWDGYFCDFDRNFSLGAPSAAVDTAHRQLVAATRAAFDMARPGIRVSALYETMRAALDLGQDCGRLGHGLGMQLTEWPSLIAADETRLAPGMVLTLEPHVRMAGGGMLVHEENIVIGDDGAEWLSSPQSPEIRVI